MRVFAPKIIGLATAMLSFCFLVLPFSDIGSRSIDLFAAAGLTAFSSMVAMVVHGLIDKALASESTKPAGPRPV